MAEIVGKTKRYPSDLTETSGSGCNLFAQRGEAWPQADDRPAGGAERNPLHRSGRLRLAHQAWTTHAARESTWLRAQAYSKACARKVLPSAIMALISAGDQQPPEGSVKWVPLWVRTVWTR